MSLFQIPDTQKYPIIENISGRVRVLLKIIGLGIGYPSDTAYNGQIKIFKPFSSHQNLNRDFFNSSRLLYQRWKTRQTLQTRLCYFSQLVLIFRPFCEYGSPHLIGLTLIIEMWDRLFKCSFIFFHLRSECLECRPALGVGQEGPVSSLKI